MGGQQVFISYNSRDAALVAPIVAALEARGIKPWLDLEHLPPGDSWRPALEQALRGCAAVAVLVAPNGVGPVQQEEIDVALTLARKDGKPVIAMRLPGSGELPLFLDLKSRIDLLDGLTGQAFENAVNRLAARVTAQPPPPPRPVPPAPKEHVLTVRQQGETFTAQWDGGNDFPLALPLTKGDLDELAWYLERYIEYVGTGDRARAGLLEQRLDDWGRRLWDALFPGGEQNGIYVGIRDHLNRPDPIPGGPRVLLTLASDSAAVLIRPWEMPRDDRGPLALRGLTLRRRLLGAPPPRPRTPDNRRCRCACC